MFLVDHSGVVKEIHSFDECPQGEYVFTKQKDAEEFSDLLLDKQIAVYQKQIDHINSKKKKKNK